MATPKYTRQTARSYPDPEGTGGTGVEITAWTDEAWNRSQEALRRYQEDQAWRRAHPFLAGARDFGGNVLGGIGNFVNDEILLNRNNIRVRNAQRNPEVMNELQKAGNFTGALVASPFLAYTAAETAPMWAPWVGRGLKSLAKPNMLAAETAGTLGMTANQWMPWLLNEGAPWAIGGTAAVMGGQYLADNPPSFSMPYTGSRVMADSAPTDSVGTGTTNPPAAPADTTAAPAQPTVAPGTSTASPAPASPEPERNDSTSRKTPFFSRVKPHLRPFGGYKGGSTVGNGVRLLRDAAYTGVGADVGFNLWDFAENPDSAQWNWGLSRILTTPERGVMNILRKGHNYGSTPKAAPAAAPQDTTKTTPATPASQQPSDTIQAVSGSQATSGDDDYQEWLNSQK